MPCEYGGAAYFASGRPLVCQNGGFDATSVREIVEAAGVAKPTLYYYFGSKEGLAQALLTVPLVQPGLTAAAARRHGG